MINKKYLKILYLTLNQKRVKHLVKYPLEEVVNYTGLCYFNNTVAYAIALAIYEKVEKINLYGIDYSYMHNLHMAEAGRACAEFWLATAIHKGIKIEVAHKSGLLDTNVPDEEKLYGYHRLKDPLVQTVNKGILEVTKQSELSSPEPQDKKPILYGRHDHV